MNFFPSPKGIDLAPIGEAEQGPLLLQMWADLFKHLSTLGVAASAGLLVLLEVNILEGEIPFWGSLSMLVVGAFLAVYGGVATVALVEAGGGSTKPLTRLLTASLFFLGVGTGNLIAALLLP